MRALVLMGCAAALTATSITACASAPINRRGNSGSAAASMVNGVQQVMLTAGDDYRFHPATFSVHPGKVEVILRNTGTGAPHDLQVTSFPADFVPLAQSGETRQATFTAPPTQHGKPTKYEFVCTIHAKYGQTGTMIVLP